MLLTIPTLSHALAACARKLNCSWVGAVQLTPKPHCRLWNCHTNTLRYVDWYGGKRVLGYYWLEDRERGKIVALLHSIVERENGQLLDITPFDDNRTYNIFSVKRDQTPDYTTQEHWFSL